MEQIYYPIGWAVTWLFIVALVVITIALGLGSVAFIATKVIITNWYQFHINRHVIPSKNIRNMYKNKPLMCINNNKSWVLKYRLRNFRRARNGKEER
ncbi:MAG TPA: hypothetical protein VK541_11330 [Pedobacter sp.]|uniref:hypothetical protein n=1 Tax=Pedobacter sp. TaxID=1411316 RepID=UPI002B5D67CD|nr:hypothetical protein [Pedobacter sp.]HMI03067.1 hypothetical protein [Pedobacter sp.]